MEKTMTLIMALLMAAIMPSACLAASHGGQRTSHMTSSHVRQSSGYSGRTTSERTSSSGRVASYRPQNSQVRYQPGNYQPSSSPARHNTGSYRSTGSPSQNYDSGDYQLQSSYHRNSDYLPQSSRHHSSGNLLTLAAGVVLGSMLNSQSCAPVVYEPVDAYRPCRPVVPVVVYNVPQPIAPTVIYDTAPVVSPECNESVAPQQSFTDNNCETSPIDEPSISITGRIQLIGLRHQTFIRIPANKSICNGSLIRFYDCKGERVGDFLVTDFDIAKCTVTVQKTWGVEPGNKAGYRINPGD